MRNAIKLLVRDAGELARYGDYLDACQRIRNGMAQATSIDTFIHSHRNEPHIAECGKLAIARCILEAEQKSKLYVDRTNSHNILNFMAVKEKWYVRFFQLLVGSATKDELQERFRQVALIVFNYDRCIEHYLHEALMHHYGINSDQACTALRALEVYHPYGTVGALPWAIATDQIGFGGVPEERQLIEISRKIKTFTEGTDVGTSEIASIRESLAIAERIVFIGFAYLDLNLELLFPTSLKVKRVREDVQVFGTTFKIWRPNEKAIQRDLCRQMAIDESRIEFSDQECGSFFDTYSRVLALR